MKVLIACEESQTVCKAFRERGHEAYSCDLKQCSGEHPEWHIQGDAIKALYSQKWDLVIAHPTCTRLANSGVLRLYREGKKVNGIDPVKWEEMEDGAAFFSEFMRYGMAGNRIAIENPIMHGHAKRKIEWFQRPSQIIQPYQFGNPESKATCLWLFGLTKLKPTNVLPKPERGYWDNQTNSGQNKLGGKNRAALRSKTYSGIAKAMAEQWG